MIHATKSYNQWPKHTKNFKSRVITNRKIPDAKLETLAQGRIWLGEEAKSNGLVDEIGSLDDTIKSFSKKH